MAKHWDSYLSHCISIDTYDLVCTRYAILCLVAVVYATPILGIELVPKHFGPLCFFGCIIVKLLNTPSMLCTHVYAFVPPTNTVIDANSIMPILPPCVSFV